MSSQRCNDPHAAVDGAQALDAAYALFLFRYPAIVARIAAPDASGAGAAGTAVAVAVAQVARLAGMEPGAYLASLLRQHAALVPLGAAAASARPR